MITLVHTADIHFGVENYGFIDHTTGLHTRLLDFKKAFEETISYAIEHTVDVFIFAGDAYKNSHPTPTHQRLLLQSLMKLYNAGIPVIIVIGNHDHSGSNAKAHALDVFCHLPSDGFYVLAKPQAITIKTKNGPLQIVGISWPNRSMLTLENTTLEVKNSSQISENISEAVRATINRLADSLDKNIPAVLVGHITVSTGCFSGSERQALCGNDPVLHVSDLAREPFDYVALGHLHRHQNLNPNGYPAVVYSGSPECIDFGEINDTKGFCVVKIPQKGKCQFTFCPIQTRPFMKIKICLSEHTDQTDQIIQELQNYFIKNAVIKIEYTIPEGSIDTVKSHRIYNECKDAWCFAGLTCTNPSRAKERRVFNLTSHNLEDSFYQYCLHNEEAKKKIDEYSKLFNYYHEKIVSSL